MPLIIIVAIVVVVAFFLAYRTALQQETGIGKKSDIKEGVLLSIRLPKENEKLPTAAEQMFASLHGLLKFTPGVQEHISLEMASSAEGINFYVFTPRQFKSFVESQIYAQYPQAEIREAVDYSRSLGTEATAMATELALAKDFLFPIKTFRDFEVDPLAAITSALGSVRNNEQIWVQILVRPVDDFWQEHGHDYVQMVRDGQTPVSLNASEIMLDVGKHILSVGGNVIPYMMKGPQEPEPPGRAPLPPKLSAGQELDLKMIENKLSKIGFETKIRLVAVAANQEIAQQRLSSVIASFKQFSTASLNSLEQDPDSPTTASLIKSYQARLFPEGEAGDYILNIEELASIFHLPNISVETPTIAWTRAKKGEPPLNLPTEGVTYMGKTIFRDQEASFGIKNPDRRKHVYIIGKTGVGKSTLIKNMIIQDMRNGYGVAILDPHGQLVDELLEFVPENRLDDVVIFNPADSDYPVALNMLELFDPKQRTLMADTLVDVFKKYFANSWGPRLEYILKNCILTLLEVPNTSLLSIIRLLVDRDYRKYIVNLINDPQMKNFWNGEFAKLEQNERLITEAISPIQNKVGQFLNSELIRNIVGQPKSTIKVDDIINNRKLFFVNLASGRIGANNTSLLGAMIVSQLQFAAMRRVDVPEEQRTDFFLYADEFQSFATDSFAVILSEARKYRLDLTITHQYIEQMPLPVKDAIFGNVGTFICFGVGNQDAAFLEKEFTPTFLANDFINLGRYEMYLKLQIDDMASTPFSAVSLPPFTDVTGVSQRAVAASRAKYSREVEKVEKLIKKWSETKFRPGQPPQPPQWALDEAKAAAEQATPTPVPTINQPVLVTSQEVQTIEQLPQASVPAPSATTVAPEAVSPQPQPAFPGQTSHPESPLADLLVETQEGQPSTLPSEQPEVVEKGPVAEEAQQPPPVETPQRETSRDVESAPIAHDQVDSAEFVEKLDQQTAHVQPYKVAAENLPTGLIPPDHPERPKEEPVLERKGEVEIFRFPQIPVNQEETQPK
ncbi:MAG TPA: type IV secretion system DNA-binding domain-containing protein [Candidatus Nanoarchaeia archaeon]|nr:hypothetical protein [uncultured archaeon]